MPFGPEHDALGGTCGHDTEQKSPDREEV
jgi:hypothetical protein